MSAVKEGVPYGGASLSGGGANLGMAGSGFFVSRYKVQVKKTSAYGMIQQFIFSGWTSFRHQGFGGIVMLLLFLKVVVFLT